jgi:hypothetical protein
MQFFIDIILVLIYGVALLLLLAWVWRFWMLYVNRQFIDKWNADSLLLEIRLPREILKSPLATETALASLIQGGSVGDWWAKNWSGNLTAWSSLEIASIEGVVRFYIRINKKFRPLVEANFYAQYPGIEIAEADDYTKLVRYHHLSQDVSMFGCSFFLSGKWEVKNEYGEPLKKGKDAYKMRADFFPIKTYLDYGLDKDPKEEFKIDPITPMIEFMGSLGKGEYFWYQILVQAEGTFDGKKFPKMFYNEVTGERLSISDMVKQWKKQLRIGKVIKKGDVALDKYGNVEKKPGGQKDADGNPILVEVKYQKDQIDKRSELDLSKEEKETLEAVDKKMSKPLVRTISRLLYLADNNRGKFNGGHIQSTLAAMKPFAGVNSFGLETTDPYTFNWEKLGGKRVDWRKEEKFNAFVERSGFHPIIPEKNESEGMSSLDWWEDGFFYPYPTKYRIMFRTAYEILFRPFASAHLPNREISVLNLEELATLWHLPGAVVTTPTLPRIDSTKGVAPVNLPQ